MVATDMKVYMAQRRAIRRQKLIDLSGGCCIDCGSKVDLEFNHKDCKTKLFSLSGYNLDTSWSKILEEWKKCELLCKEHHLERTRKQYKNKEIKIWNEDIHGPYIHGTVRTYQEEKCKCSRCKTAKKIYRQGGKGYNEVLA